MAETEDVNAAFDFLLVAQDRTVSKGFEEGFKAGKEEGKQEAVVEEGAFYSKKCKLFYKKEVLFEITF